MCRLDKSFASKKKLVKCKKFSDYSSMFKINKHNFNNCIFSIIPFEFV
jgi:hypothetical protein